MLPEGLIQEKVTLFEGCLECGGNQVGEAVIAYDGTWTNSLTGWTPVVGEWVSICWLTCQGCGSWQTG